MDVMIHEVPPTRPDEAPLSLDELLVARSKLDEEIAWLRAETIENVKRYIAEFNISSAELFGPPARPGLVKASLRPGSRTWTKRSVTR